MPNWLKALSIKGMNPNDYDLTTNWPPALDLERLSVLQCPTDLNLRESIHQKLKTECRRKIIQSSDAMRWAGLYFSSPKSPVPADKLLATTDRQIEAQAFKNWLVQNCIVPSEYIASWFDACNISEELKSPNSKESTGPAPLTTSEIAFCFGGLRWSEDEWKKPLGDKPKWLETCLVSPGTRGRGGSPRLWNPVFIGAALTDKGYAQFRTVRARFQTKTPLQPWLETWESYEADHSQTE